MKQSQVRQAKCNMMQRSRKVPQPPLDDRPSTVRAALVVRICVCLLAIPASGIAQDVAALLEESIIKVVEKSEPSVVSIARIKPAPPEQIPARHKTSQQEIPPVSVQPNDFGSGCIVCPPKSVDRMVLTNYHVVRGGPVFGTRKLDTFQCEDGTELWIRFTDRRACRGAIIAADPRSDLAVLRLEWEPFGINPTDFPGFDWEIATPPRKGQFVILLGNPYAIARDGSASVSWGMVSNMTRQPVSNQPIPRDENEGIDDVAKIERATKMSMLHRLGAVMQLDARMNLGLSGGPVLNIKGELIGISTSLAAIEGYEQSVGFALPIDTMTHRIIETLLAGREVEYGMLGILPYTMRRRNSSVSIPGHSSSLRRL